MGLKDWIIVKLNDWTTAMDRKRLARLEQQQREEEAYNKAYAEARVEHVASEAAKDAVHGGHFKRVLAEKMANIKENLEDKKKRDAKSKSILNIPIKAKVE